MAWLTARGWNDFFSLRITDAGTVEIVESPNWSHYDSYETLKILNHSFVIILRSYYGLTTAQAVEAVWNITLFLDQVFILLLFFCLCLCVCFYSFE